MMMPRSEGERDLLGLIAFGSSMLSWLLKASPWVFMSESKGRLVFKVRAGRGSLK